MFIINLIINISFDLNYNKYTKGKIRSILKNCLQIRNIWKFTKESIYSISSDARILPSFKFKF